MKNIKIGKRNIKTAISVFLALSVYIILYLLDFHIGKEEESFVGLTAIYTPFFAAIAAAYTSHRDFKSSLKQAKIRSVGSVIGGYFGMLLILLVESLISINNYPLFLLIEYMFVGIGIIALIYLGVIFKQTDATFISCLTYLSVTISIRNGGMGIVEFASNRIISTLIGVAIALLVNNFRFSHKKNKNVLFIAGIDSGINYNDYPLSYTRYKLNYLYQKDAKLLLHTKRSGLDSRLFSDVSVNKPLILMDGVCIYDEKNKDYIYSCDFVHDIKIKLNEYLLKEKLDAFTYVIHDNRLVCHYQNITNDASKNYFEKEKRYDNYPFAYAEVLDSCDVAMYVLFVDSHNLEKIKNDLSTLKLLDYLKISIKQVEGSSYYKIRIKPFNSNRYETMKHLPYYDECDIKIAFINHSNDLLLEDEADFKICLNDSASEIKEICDYIIKSSDFNDVLKLFNKIYYARDLNKYLNKLKKKKS